MSQELKLILVGCGSISGGWLKAAEWFKSKLSRLLVAPPPQTALPLQVLRRIFL
jgi:hypothetical protein